MPTDPAITPHEQRTANELRFALGQFADQCRVESLEGSGNNHNYPHWKRAEAHILLAAAELWPIARPRG